MKPRAEQSVDVGTLNRRVQLQVRTATQDEYGAPLATWTTVYACWASIAVQDSQLIYSTSEFVSKATHRIVIRWTGSVVVQPNMRIVYVQPTTGVTHTYNIEAVLNPEQANRKLLLLAYELDANE